MSWQDHGPGTMEWDMMFGGNDSGLYPEEEHFILEISGNEVVLQRATFSNAGGGNWSTVIDCEWNVQEISKDPAMLLKGEKFTLLAEGDPEKHRFRVSSKFRQTRNSKVIDIID